MHIRDIISPLTFTLAFFFLLTNPILAMDLEEIYELALENDHRLRKATVIRAGSWEIVQQSNAKFWPKIVAQAYYTENRQNRTEHSFDNSYLLYSKPEFSSSGYNLRITQPLFNYYAIVNNKQALARHNLANIEYNETSHDLILRVIKAYIGVLAAREEIRYRELEKKALSKQLRLTENRRNMGVSADIDAKEINARYDQAAAKSAAANIRLSISNEALREITGRLHDNLESLSNTAPSDMPNPNNISFWIKTAHENNYRLQVAQQQLKIARIDIYKQRSPRFPNISLIASYNYYNNLEFDYDGVELETSSITARLDWNFYQGGLISSQIRQAEHFKAQIDISLQQQKRLIERRIRDAYYILVGGVTRINKLKQSIKSQKVVLKAIMASYKAGKRTNLDALDARTNLYDLKRELAQARHDHVLQYAILKYNAGILSADDIEQINQHVQICL